MHQIQTKPQLKMTTNRQTLNQTLDPIWEEKYSHGHTVKYPYDSVITFVFRHAPRDLDRKQVKILEVGCGTGNNLWFAAREGFSVFGVDGSKSAISFAKELFEREELQGDLRVADFTNLAYDNDFFDLVIDRGSLTCCGFKAAAEAISEIYRVLKPGGKFFFNPYSEEHSSFAAGIHDEDGLVTKIEAGSMTNVGQICFYSKQKALEALGNKFKIESIRNMVDKEVSNPAVLIHAEWRIIASK